MPDNLKCPECGAQISIPHIARHVEVSAGELGGSTRIDHLQEFSSWRKKFNIVAGVIILSIFGGMVVWYFDKFIKLLDNV